MRLRAGQGPAVSVAALALVQDVRRRGETCRPLVWIPELHHPAVGGEAVVRGALFSHRSGCDGGAALRAFVGVEPPTTGPGRRPPDSVLTHAFPPCVPTPAPGA